MVVRVPHVLFVSTVAACAGPRTELVFERTIPLPGARFAGPVTVDVPRRDAFSGRDLEYVVELEARCTPALQIGYPDGEVAMVGSSDGIWQDLLARRAAAGVKAEEPPAPAAPVEQPAATVEQPAATAPEPPAASTAPGTAPAPTGPTPIYVGRWERHTTESWPGQLRFLAERDRRCTSSDRWTRRYLTGLDETGQITVWASTPQELDGARLTVRVYAVGDVVVPRAPVAAVTVKAEVKTQVRVRPPKPAPKAERPGRSKDPGGVWRPGHWSWTEGQGRWVWISGDWGPPSTTPAPKTENRGAVPAPGARWKDGYWAWVVNDGSWTWEPGEWLEPPPLVENPGTPQVPEQEWVAGMWIKTGVTFTWKPGYWGRPRPRVETPPSGPSGGRWIAGTWLRKNNQWIWSPGYYERVGRPPPAPRAETPTAKPEPDAVWLSGFWRWEDARNDYVWVAGYWERPPGEGYTWVWDEIQPVVVATPNVPAAPVVRRTGRWILKVDVDIKLRGGRR